MPIYADSDHQRRLCIYLVYTLCTGWCIGNTRVEGWVIYRIYITCGHTSKTFVLENVHSNIFDKNSMNCDCIDR